MFSEEAKEFLSRRGIPFEERDIEKDPAAIADLERMGTVITPFILVDGEPVIGFDEERLAALLGL